ncbi:MAG: hypothetical protein JHD15_07050 [Phenylobacterium sp.]|uniref:hypothetical protein n=1 Tax=Phenylobacterium sp. TaxID=1871053 RepID=UPI001A1C4B68|nr:hypothetical protein [Phenylobacterium sp.]MBJ7410110.1 hypothetical protein [Phenylobacterium sp.]
MIAIALKALTSHLTGPIALFLCVLLAFALLGQCQATGTATRALAKSQAEVKRMDRDLGTCLANGAAFDEARKRQNAALAAASAADAQRLTEAGKRLSEAVQGRERAEARAAKLLKAGPVGVDACVRAMDAFETVKEQAR